MLQQTTGEISYKFFNTFFNIRLSTEEFQILHFGHGKIATFLRHFNYLKDICTFFLVVRFVRRYNLRPFFSEWVILLPIVFATFQGLLLFCKIVVTWYLGIIIVTITRHFLTSRFKFKRCIVFSSKIEWDCILCH